MHLFYQIMIYRHFFGGDIAGRRVDQHRYAVCQRGAGLSVEEFEKQIGKYNGLSYKETEKLIIDGVIEPSYMWNQNGWLCSQLGLHVCGLSAWRRSAPPLPDGLPRLSYPARPLTSTRSCPCLPDHIKL